MVLDMMNVEERACIQILNEIEEKLSIVGLDRLEIPDANLTIMLSILDRLIKLERIVNNNASS